MSSWSELRPRNVIVAMLAAILCLALLAPRNAGAATVVNGDFETGTLSGWQVQDFPSSSPPENSWFVYSGTTAPTSGNPVPAPPQGKFAATSDQGGPGTHFLYQDVALEPYYAHTLSMIAYYESQAPIAIPSPDTLSYASEQPNQQYRIDVMKPTAAIDSLNPADILATILATKTGDPQVLAPTQFTADLTPFAGQTVRLRLVEVDNQFFFNAGVDAVSIASTPPSNVFSFGKAKLNRKKGTAELPVTVPGAGVIVATDARFTAGAVASVSKVKRLVKSVTLTTVAGTLNLPIKPTKAARKILKAKHKLRIKMAVTFTPTGGSAATQTFSLVLRLKPRT